MPDGPARGGEVSLGIGLGRADWRLRASIGGAYFPAQTTMLAAGGEGGTFALLSLSLRACGLAALGRFEAGPCLGGQLDRMSASGIGSPTLFDAEQASGWWGAGLAGAAASWRLSPRWRSSLAARQCSRRPSRGSSCSPARWWCTPRRGPRAAPRWESSCAFFDGCAARPTPEASR